ncbi:MAG TPA: GNAT family N-acetyltransferase [Thermoanaerobaculia bacterium]
MHFRRATPSDAGSIVDFQLRMARETESMELDRAVCTRGVRAVFERPELGEYYVAEEDGRVAGSLLVTYEWSDWRAGVVWWIQSVYVPEAFRKRGVYSGLYRHLKELAVNDENVRGIRLYVDRRNTRAQEVYARLGMNGEHYQVFEWMKE